MTRPIRNWPSPPGVPPTSLKERSAMGVSIAANAAVLKERLRLTGHSGSGTISSPCRPERGVAISLPLAREGRELAVHVIPKPITLAPLTLRCFGMPLYGGTLCSEIIGRGGRYALPICGQNSVLHVGCSRHTRCPGARYGPRAGG